MHFTAGVSPLRRIVATALCRRADLPCNSRCASTERGGYSPRRFAGPKCMTRSRDKKASTLKNRDITR